MSKQYLFLNLKIIAVVFLLTLPFRVGAEVSDLQKAQAEIEAFNQATVEAQFDGIKTDQDIIEDFITYIYEDYGFVCIVFPNDSVALYGVE